MYKVQSVLKVQLRAASAGLLLHSLGNSSKAQYHSKGPEQCHPGHTGSKGPSPCCTGPSARAQALAQQSWESRGAAAEVLRLKETLLREMFLLRTRLSLLCKQRSFLNSPLAFASTLYVFLLSQVASSIKRQPWTLALLWLHPVLADLELIRGPSPGGCA